MRLSPLLVLIATLMTAGCSAHIISSDTSGLVDVRPDDYSDSYGRGAIISDRHVLTVAHVIHGGTGGLVSTTRSGGWVEAKVVCRIKRAPEDLVVLELPVDNGAYGLLLGFEGFPVEQIISPSDGGRPTVVRTRRGTLLLEPGVLVPGDSGSPLLDDRGCLVGLVSGRCGNIVVYVPTSRFVP